MSRKLCIFTTALTTLALLAGCSASQGFSFARNAARKDSYLKVKLDGQAAKQNLAKKTVAGYSEFKIPEPVSTTPTLVFEIEDTERFGRVTSVIINIFKEHANGYSNQAEYIIASKETGRDNQLQAGTEYDLGNLPGQFRVLDFDQKDVEGVSLQPGTKYMMNLVVAADKSETAQIYFEVN
jgi:hypothetical protein